MRRHATFLVLTLAVAALFMNVAAAQKPPQPKTDSAVKLLTTQMEAAQNAYRAAVDKMQIGQVGGFQVLVNSNHPSPEEAYTWSVRRLNAQRDLSANKDERIAAFADHQKRMKELKEKAIRLVGEGKGGFMTPADSAVAAPAADWYLAEAELWLLQERGK